MRAYSYGWYSHRVHKHMEFLHFGHAGAPVLVFPTSGGNHTEFAERGMIEPLAWKIDQGLIQVFCVDTTNWEGFYNEQIHPRRRMEKYMAFEQYLLQEFLPHLRRVACTDYLVVSGISFGAYHAMNFALKHPDIVNKAVALSGTFDIKPFLEGYYDEDCYFNNPVDYMQSMNDPWFLDQYNTRTELIMVTSDADVCLERNREMSRHLGAKGIRHDLITWEGGYIHDWPAWRQMIGHYL
jgi:esterase/lipase superfamily enzyme